MSDDVELRENKEEEEKVTLEDNSKEEEEEEEEDEMTIQLKNDISDKWDYVFLFQNVDQPRDKNGNPITDGKEVKKFNEIQDERQQMVERLRKAGLTVEVTRVQAKNNNDKDFVLITAPLERLEREAEQISMSMRLKLEYGGAYSEFEVEKRHLFRLNDAERGQLFRKAQRIQLLESIIENAAENGGAEISFVRSIRKGLCNKIFPLHEPAKIKWLLDNWAKPNNFFRTQPIDAIRDYFGEEVAIYFAWLGFYTSWLWLATGFGFVAFIFWLLGLSLGSGWTDYAVWSSVIYAIFLSLWATFFLEYWKRYQNKLIHKWGMLGFEEQERQRADYVGVRKEGLYYKGEWIVPWEKKEEKKGVFGKVFGAVGEHVDKNLAKVDTALDLEGGHDYDEEFARIEIDPIFSEYYPSPFRLGKISAAMPVVTTMLIAVVIATFCVLSLRLLTQRKTYSFLGSMIGGIVNGITIMLFNGIWRKLADAMTRWENHRTMTSYRDQLIFKIFMFQFFNSYTSLYYIAFFKNGMRFWNSTDPDLEDVCKVGEPDYEIIGNGCVFELSVQVATLLGTNITVGQTREVLLPWLISQIKLKLYNRSQASEEEVKESKKITQYERESNLVDYPGTFDEYNEMIIQYGYITLFAAAFPVAPLMAVANNMVEIRTDAIKFLTGHNRPHSRGAQDIGTWYFILEVMGVIAVITNCLLIGFSYSTVSKLFDNRDPFKTFAVVVVLEHVLLVLKLVISILIPDMPGKVRKDMAKEDFIKEYTYKKAQERLKQQLKDAKKEVE